MHPLLHADETQAFASFHGIWVEASPRVGDPQVDRRRASDEFNPGVSCAAVLHHVRESFLRDPIEAEGDIFRNWSLNIAVGKLEPDIVLKGELSAQTFHCSHEPQLLDFGRMKPVG